MTTEVLTLANSIAASKEDIRQALIARNVTCGSEVPLADYADKINNMVVSGEVDNVLATNYTGAAITAGDKVYLQPNATVSQSSTTVYGSTSNYCYVVNRKGTMANYGQYAYIPSLSGSIDYTNSLPLPSDYMPIYYDEHGNLFKKNLCLTDGRVSLGVIVAQDDYATENRNSSSSSHYFYKVDANNNFAITKTWTVGQPGANPSTSISVVIGDKLYMSAPGGSFSRVGTIDQESDTIALNTDTSYCVLYSTKDNALAIVCTRPTTGTWYGYSGVKLLSVNNDYTLGNEFISANSDLNNLLSMSQIYVVFNRSTGILCISTYASDSYYGVFKYENGDFTTVNITLDGFTAELYQWLSVSDDMSKLQIGRYLYTLAQTADGNYKAIPYSTFALGSTVLTGVALENAAIGANFNAKTIIP